ncbi:MAG TPA: aldo/keto reductase [Roseiflexaceae bacterium]|nr:aldo/keto reductase [Roseiflexaceae bacterium]
MEYRSLGRTGMQVSALSLGTMLFGGETDEATAAALVERAIEAGVNSIDTANAYGRGRSEEVLGRVLARTGKRQRLVLATKVHVRMDDSDPNAGGNHRRHIIEQCHASLRRLGTDYLDIYYIHRPSTLVPIDETLRALDDLVRAGLVRYIGTSSFAAWQILEGLWAAKEYHLNRFVVEQTPYHLLDRRAERELIPMAHSYGVGLTIWSPLAGGFLTGKYRRGAARPAVARFRDTGERSAWAERHFVDAAFDLVEQTAAIAAEQGCTPAQIALAWTLQREGVSSVVLGARDVAQLDQQLGACDVRLTPDDTARLDRASPPGGVIVPYFLDDSFADFRPHRHRW